MMMLASSRHAFRRYSAEAARAVHVAAVPNWINGEAVPSQASKCVSTPTTGDVNHFREVFWFLG